MSEPALSLRGLSKTYRGGREALKGIDLDVNEGDFFALLGPNGAGKSTTIGIVSGLVRKTAGTVRVFGHDIDTERSRAAALVGLVPQEFNFAVFEPVIEVVVNYAGFYGIPRHEAESRADHYLKRLGLWGHRTEMARYLSGGLKRRLMIARALVTEPRLLILDEPTAGVDIELRHSLWEFLTEINRAGKTIILTTHYLEEAERLCRDIAIIDHGRIVEHTSVRSLIDSLHRETFVLDLAAPLTSPPVLTGRCVTLIDPRTLEVEIGRDERLNDIFCELSDHDIHVTSMRNKTNRLEQIFMNMVREGNGSGGAQP